MGTFVRSGGKILGTVPHLPILGIVMHAVTSTEPKRKQAVRETRILAHSTREVTGCGDPITLEIRQTSRLSEWLHFAVQTSTDHSWREPNPASFSYAGTIGIDLRELRTPHSSALLWAV
jgi:hypothetical protein